MQDRFFTDEELVAFLDGESDFTPMDEISIALETDQALQRRLNALDLNRAEIASSFKGLLPDAAMMPDVGTTGVEPLRRNAGQWIGYAAAIGLAVAVGFGAGFTAKGPQRSGWTEYVAAYQALYSNATLANFRQTPEAQQTQLNRVAASIGKTISVDALSMFPEARYKRAQILNFQGRDLVQLAFMTNMGEPIALCIIYSGGKPIDELELKTMEGLSTAFWSKDGYEYFLIGGRDAALTNRFATGFAAAKI